MKKTTRVNRYLQKTGLKAYLLADMAKVPRTSLYRWLKGNGDLPLSQWDKIEKIINKG